MCPVTSVGLTLHHAAVNIFIYGNTEMNKETLFKGHFANSCSFICKYQS